MSTITDAIYQGLVYGCIAGFSVGGFLLTLSVLYGAIELLSFILGVHHKYFTSKGDMRDRGPGR